MLVFILNSLAVYPRCFSLLKKIYDCKYCEATGGRIEYTYIYKNKSACDMCTIHKTNIDHLSAPVKCVPFIGLSKRHTTGIATNKIAHAAAAAVATAAHQHSMYTASSASTFDTVRETREREK